MRIFITLVTIISFACAGFYTGNKKEMQSGEWDGTFNGHVLAPDFPWEGIPSLDLEIHPEDLPSTPSLEFLQPRESQWI